MSDVGRTERRELTPLKSVFAVFGGKAEIDAKVFLDFAVSGVNCRFVLCALLLRNLDLVAALCPPHRHRYAPVALYPRLFIPAHKSQVSCARPPVRAPVARIIV